MRTDGVFQLHIEAEAEEHPRKVSIVVAGIQPNEQGTLHLTTGCMTLDEFEGCINTLQDELDVLRARAREAFTAGAGHA